MRKIFATLLLALSLAVPVSTSSPWPLIAETLKKAVVLVESKDGLCTGFVIDNARDHVLTAAHCDGQELVVDGIPAKVLNKAVKDDLLVLKVDGIDRAPLKLASKNPAEGTEVASRGFGYGLEESMFRRANVSIAGVHVPAPGFEGPYVFLDATFVPGQSGGPVVNSSGEVVMVVQFGTGSVGAGVGAERIQKRVGRYFALPGSAQ